VGILKGAVMGLGISLASRFYRPLLRVGVMGAMSKRRFANNFQKLEKTSLISQNQQCPAIQNISDVCRYSQRSEKWPSLMDIVKENFERSEFPQVKNENTWLIEFNGDFVPLELVLLNTNYRQLVLPQSLGFVSDLSLFFQEKFKDPLLIIPRNVFYNPDKMPVTSGVIDRGTNLGLNNAEVMSINAYTWYTNLMLEKFLRRDIDAVFELVEKKINESGNLSQPLDLAVGQVLQEIMFHLVFITSGLNKLPPYEGKYLYREWTDYKKIEEQLRAKYVGGEPVLKWSFTSTAMKSEAVDPLRVHGLVNMKSSATDISMLSQLEHEQEVLIHPYTLFKPKWGADSRLDLTEISVADDWWIAYISERDLQLG
jgi:hypothetical protein